MHSRPAQQEDYFQIADTPVFFDHAGALWLPRERVLVFSDLHFEKGSSYGRKGLFLPPYDTRRTLNSLAEAIARLKPLTVVSLGDAFHDTDAEIRMDQDDMAHLQAMVRQVDWIWVLGNHDPAPPRSLEGTSCDSIMLDGLFFSHEPAGSGAWQVAGHMHPAAKVARGGRVIRRRCFMTDGNRLIMPAFGAYTGGLNILDPACTQLFPNGFSGVLLGESRVWQVATSELRPDT